MKCPHPDCGKKIGQLIARVDHSKIPRETFYVCPHCKNRINLNVEEKNLKFPSHSRKIRKEMPSSCPHYFGFLKLFSSTDQIPEECLTCKRLTECTDKVSPNAFVK
ncbi:MAG: hypothetical protein JSV85_07045 [Candidatus Bathyarchaeota archaeon]|nr:MAG: hypothetical protein JSV85_07045 [Candidatus Bathyarchaeota archaeon]